MINKANDEVKKNEPSSEFDRSDVESLFRKGQDSTMVFDKADNGSLKKTDNDDNGRTLMINSLPDIDISNGRVSSNADKSTLTPENSALSKAYSPKKVSEKKLQARKIRNATITSARVFWGILLSVFIIGVSTYLAYSIIGVMQDFTGIAKTSTDIDVTIPKDADTDKVGKILKENGVLKNSWILSTYINFTDSTAEFKEGVYTLNPKMSVSDILFELSGKKMVAETVSVTIIEGMTAEEIGELLEENYLCRAEDFKAVYKNLVNKYSFESRLTADKNKFYQLEGFLFPNTYEFYTVSQLKKTDQYDTTKQAQVAANKMLSEFNEVIKKYYTRMEEMNMSLNEVITLASMIQKEATTMESMKMVSSVFHNRLNKSETFPKLESDVTTFYVKNVIKPHYPVDSYPYYQEMFDAYDTYVTFGLPVGPICNPGEDAIKAALYPEDTPYYFFLTDSEMNNFYYAITDEEHEENKKKAKLV